MRTAIEVSDFGEEHHEFRVEMASRILEAVHAVERRRLIKLRYSTVLSRRLYGIGEVIKQKAAIIADARDVFSKFEHDARVRVDRLLALGAAGHSGTCFGCFERPMP